MTSSETLPVELIQRFSKKKISRRTAIRRMIGGVVALSAFLETACGSQEQSGVVPYCMGGLELLPIPYERPPSDCRTLPALELEQSTKQNVDEVIKPITRLLR